jgi:hypothetical protein
MSVRDSRFGHSVGGNVDFYGLLLGSLMLLVLALSASAPLVKTIRDFIFPKNAFNYENFKAYLLVVGTILGALWSGFVFAFGAERSMREDNPSLDISFDVKHDGPCDSGCIIVTTVKAKNTGNRFVALNLEPTDLLTVVPVCRSADNTIEFKHEHYYSRLEKLVDGKVDYWRAAVVHPGETSRWTFLTAVRRPGAYFIQFMIPSSRRDAKVMSARSGISLRERPDYWTQSTYYVVADESEPKPALTRVCVDVDDAGRPVE